LEPSVYQFEQEAVASREDLLKEIKSSSRKGGGLSIKGLKDRWASAVTEIEALEMEGLVLVTRPMKEGVPGPPKMVFWNDLPPKDGNPIQKIEPGVYKALASHLEAPEPKRLI
jgi:transcription initiation factor TFIIE subunit beta